MKTVTIFSSDKILQVINCLQTWELFYTIVKTTNKQSYWLVETTFTAMETSLEHSQLAQCANKSPSKGSNGIVSDTPNGVQPHSKHTYIHTPIHLLNLAYA